MIGVSMRELREWLTWGHDAEFTYDGRAYVMQPEYHDGHADMVIWDMAPEGKCISRHPFAIEGDIPSECIDAVLNDKCFDGKSFMEIESDVTVDAIM